MSFDREYQALSKLGRYTRILIYVTGIAMSSLMLLACVLPLRERATAVGLPIAANVLLVLWICLLVFKRHYLGRALEQSRKVFESEHLNRTVIETAPVGLGLISGALTRFEPLARKKGLRLRGVPSLDTTLPMCGDPARLGQMISNLLSDALKFTEAGEVTLRAAVRRDIGVAPALDIEVADTGIGIPDEPQARLFRPFSQVDASIGRRSGGTGPGLALSARLAEAMGGAIAVRSRPGDGRCFSVRLPVGTPRAESDRPRFAGERVVFVAADDAEHADVVPVLRVWGLTVRALRHPAQVGAATIRAAAALILCGPRGTWHAQEERGLVDQAASVIDIGTEKPGSPVRTARVISVSGDSPKGWAIALRHALDRESLARGAETRMRPVLPRRLKVLVAEDHAVNRWLLVEQLALLGCDAHGVGDGEQALTCLAGTRYDVLLSDLQMPGMDGLALIRRVRAQWPRMPAIVITADLTPQRRAACEAAGASGTVGKPVSLDALACVLARCCGAPDQVPENAHEDGWLGGKALPESIWATFLASYEASCAEIRAAWQRRDARSLLAELHTLRGAAGVFRLKTLAARCNALEAHIGTHGLGAITEGDLALPLDDDAAPCP
jgi:two-component system capsular synthesis sensor histidine kinase RcsC